MYIKNLTSEEHQRISKEVFEGSGDGGSLPLHRLHDREVPAGNLGVQKVLNYIDFIYKELGMTSIPAIVAYFFNTPR